MQLRLPKKDSAVFRALVTFLQTTIALLVIVLAMPEFNQVVSKYYPDALPAIAILTTIVTFIWNLIRKDVRNY